MKIFRGLILTSILVAVAAIAYWQYQSNPAMRSSLGGLAPARSLLPGGDDITEEQWSVMEVSDQIVFLLHPERIKEAQADKRVSAKRNRTDPVSYAVTAGPAKGTVSLNTSVWDPATYQAWCQAVSSERSAPANRQSPDILTELLIPQIGTFLALDDRLSAELAAHPRDPGICTDAALLLGTMAWFDGAGHFQDVRPLLHRMTAFLAVADTNGARGTNRDVAEILRLVLLHDQVAALKKIAAARQSNSSIPPVWLAALEVTASRDWRKTEPQAAAGPVLLQLAHYRVLVGNMGANKAESFLKTLTKPQGADWTRAITQAWELGVQQGHTYSRSLLSQEAAEANTIAKTVIKGTLSDSKDAYAKFVTQFDGRSGFERPPEARIVGTQNWAGRTQRHFLQAMVVLNKFLRKSLGLPQEADAFAKAMRQQFSGAYYFPFVALELEKPGSAAAAEAQTAGEKMAREHPAMVAPKLWAALKPESTEGLARHTPDFHVFYNPELPRHTSFEAGKRIVEIGIGDENNLSLMQSIAIRCPYDFEMAMQTAMVEGRPNNVEGKKGECYARFIDTHSWAMDWAITQAVKNPEEFERLKLVKATWDPDAYIELSSYFEKRNDTAKVEKYLLLARGKVDEVYFANSCDFLVKHYAREGRVDEAESLAKEAADTYSASGLRCYAWLKEHRHQWGDALKTYRAMDQRYSENEHPNELGYIMRRKVAGEGWNPDFQKTFDSRFPRGIEKVSLASLGSAAPASGACFTLASRSLRQLGIGLKDVVVAVDGLRVENREQYYAIRDMSDDPNMALLVWNGQSYSEVKAHQPGRRFQTDLRDYRK